MSREERLQAKITEALEKGIEEGLLPCGNVLLVREGKVICYAEAGKDPGTGAPVQRDTIFRLYSQTKPITSAAVCLLMERGVIDMNDPVEKYLPGFEHPQVLREDGSLEPANRSVTLMDLMGMAAGLCYPMDDAPGKYAAELFERNQAEMDTGRPGLSTVEMANEIGKLPLAFHPGTGYRYSTCADVLGAVVEVADGRSYSRFLKEELFDPLEMADTGFWVPEEKLNRLVTCAARSPEGIRVMECRHLNVGNYTREPAFASGGAGLVSTLEDYRHFAGMLLNSGKYHGEHPEPGDGAVDDEAAAPADVALGRPGGLRLRQADADLRGSGAGAGAGPEGRIRLGRMAGDLLCQLPGSGADHAAEPERGGHGYRPGDPADPEHRSGGTGLKKQRTCVRGRRSDPRCDFPPAVFPAPGGEGRRFVRA